MFNKLLLPFDNNRRAVYNNISNTATKPLWSPMEDQGQTITSRVLQGQRTALLQVHNENAQLCAQLDALKKDLSNKERRLEQERRQNQWSAFTTAELERKVTQQKNEISLLQQSLDMQVRKKRKDQGRVSGKVSANHCWEWYAQKNSGAT